MLNATETTTLCTIIAKNGRDFRSYSGRGMFGKKCLAISGESVKDCMRKVSEVVLTLMDNYADEPKRMYLDMVQTLMCPDADSMGTGVVLYWRDLPAPTFKDDDDSDD
jgi:hypothetical protein